MTSVLFILFLTLKLTHVIEWSWWWVTAPLWGSFVVFFVIAIVGLLWLIVKQPDRAKKAGLLR